MFAFYYFDMIELPNMSYIDIFSVFNSVTLGFQILFTYWWVYIPPMLFLGVWNGWQHYVTEKYVDALEWTILKVKPPPALDRSLKAVEQIFSSLHGIYIGPTNWKDRFFRGKIPDWFSLEIVGAEGVTDFYVRTLSQYRHMVETSIFAQYPDAEIIVAEDYMKKWPRYLPNNEMDLFGMELLLAKENAYPIQTYLYFEEKMAGPDQLKRLDPLSAVSEVFSIFRPGEDFVIQILIRPVGEDWAKKGQDVIDKIQGKEPKKKVDVLEGIMQSVDTLFIGPAVTKEDQEKKEKRLSPLETDAIKAIGNKISKLGFETSIRLAYIAKKEIFHRHHFAAIIGAFKQLSTQNLNSFKPNSATVTYSKGRFSAFFPSDKGFFVDQITLKKKWMLYRKLINRVFPQRFFVFNTEELATVFHLPGLEVKAPLFPRVEAKKGQPPSGLPLEF